jgi:ribosomal protein S5
MLEEFRRRKNLRDFHEIKDAKDKLFNKENKIIDRYFESDKEKLQHKHTFSSAGPERYFEPSKDEVFNPSDFTMIFMDSDSVTNVTSLNRVNKRRVLLFIGNGQGLISFGKGKGEDYESAFDQAFKKLRNNLVCIDIDPEQSSCTFLEGRHNDFRIKIWPQNSPNFWGNPTIWKILLHSGLVHCRFSCKSRKRDPYSLLYAYFAAVTQNTTPDAIARMQG